MEEIALTYNTYGLACLPTSKDKSPCGVSTWKDGVKDLSLFKNAHGIGIVCGSLSGGLECMDFDNHFGDAKEVISAFILEPEVNEIYSRHQFIVESTVSGGYHLVYRCENANGNTKLARRPVWREERKRYEPDAIIETRGEGGYFVAAPTPGYKIVRGSFANISTITKSERDILFSIARTYNTWKDREVTSREEEKEKPGDIYNNKSEAINDAKNCLKSAGWDEVRPGIWRRPGKKDGISATFGKVADNVFYNFSSSAYPFEPNAAYKPFQVVALLKYNGDFSAFAKELSEKYSDVVASMKPEKKEEEPKDNNELAKILLKALVDVSIPIAKPPIALHIRDGVGFQRLFTLGNFSAITGKGKSKKSFFLSMLEAAAASGHEIQGKFWGTLPENKQLVLRFDTEQSRYDAWIATHRVHDIIGRVTPNFSTIALREFTPIQRCEIIEYALKKNHDKIGLIAIDGIADLAKAINDEEEATRVGSLLMRWSAEYNVHIITVIHQNKGDNFATGHLGSMIIKKAEVVIGIERDASNKSRSKVTCDNIRGVADFDDFVFEIVDQLPVVDGNYKPIKSIDF